MFFNVEIAEERVTERTAETDNFMLLLINTKKPRKLVDVENENRKIL